jgi:hypothetical protein
MQDDGTCPVCGDAIELPVNAAQDAERSDEKAPWHFKLMIVTVTVYLGWRLVQLLT